MLTRRANSFTIRRITSATAKYTRVAVYIALTMAWWSCGVVVLGALFSCRPVEAVWASETGHCAGGRVLVVLGRAGAMSTVVADVLLVLLPLGLLCKFQMNRWKKWQMEGMLIFASMFVSSLAPSPPHPPPALPREKYVYQARLVLDVSKGAQSLILADCISSDSLCAFIQISYVMRAINSTVDRQCECLGSLVGTGFPSSAEYVFIDAHIVLTL